MAPKTKAKPVRVERAYDGVRLAVLGKRFESVASKMANTLLPTVFEAPMVG